MVAIAWVQSTRARAALPQRLCERCLSNAFVGYIYKKKKALSAFCSRAIVCVHIKSTIARSMAWLSLQFYFFFSRISRLLAFFIFSFSYFHIDVEHVSANGQEIDGSQRERDETGMISVSVQLQYQNEMVSIKRWISETFFSHFDDFLENALYAEQTNANFFAIARNYWF